MKEERKEKEEDEQNRNFKFGFFQLVKGLWNFWGKYRIRILKGSSLKLFELLCLAFLGVVHIPYV